jgi:hypothetical protein
VLYDSVNPFWNWLIFKLQYPDRTRFSPPIKRYGSTDNIRTSSIKSYRAFRISSGVACSIMKVADVQDIHRRRPSQNSSRLLSASKILQAASLSKVDILPHGPGRQNCDGTNNVSE